MSESTPEEPPIDRLTEESEKVLLDYIKLRMTQPHFANARSVRNAIDRARMRLYDVEMKAQNDIVDKNQEDETTKKTARTTGDVFKT